MTFDMVRYIDDDITGPDRELLTAFYTAANSEGGTADEIHIRGIRAAIAQAASGFAEPPLPTNNLAPVRSADRPWKEPGWCDARGQCWWTVDDRTMDRRRWMLVNPALLGGGWVLPHWAIPAIPAAETNPAEVQPWPGGDVTQHGQTCIKFSTALGFALQRFKSKWATLVYGKDT